MKFFFDRNIARQLARMVAGYETEHEVVHLDDDRRFDPRSQDVFILESLASEDPKPVFLTGDLNMRTKHPQLILLTLRKHERRQKAARQGRFSLKCL